jgi:hypothetical protein
MPVVSVTRLLAVSTVTCIPLPFLQLQRMGRLEHAVFVDGFGIK